MANAATITSTWSSEYVRSFMLKPLFVESSIAEQYTVDPTVNKSKTYSQAAELNRIVQTKLSCGFSASGTLAITEKVLSTCTKAINLEQCYQEFNDTVFKASLKKGTDIDDLTDTDIAELIATRAVQGGLNDIDNLAWFGDTASGTSFYTCFDGWFKLFEAGIPAAQKIPIIGATVTTGLPAGAARTTLQSMYEAQPKPLRGVATKVFYVDSEMYDNLITSYEGLGNEIGQGNLESGNMNMRDGVLRYRGIPVIEKLNWATEIAAESLAYTNRAVLTVKENLVVGTNILDPNSDAKLFFDDLEEKFYFKSSFDLGVQYMFNEWVVYARG